MTVPEALKVLRDMGVSVLFGKSDRIFGNNEDGHADGTLGCLGPWVSWHTGDTEPSLDGDFELVELEAIITWIRATQEERLAAMREDK